MAASDIIPLPRWIYTIRGLQIFFSVVILGLAAHGIYWLILSSWGFAIFTSVATWIVVTYIYLVNLVPSCHGAYNYWAILALDAVCVIFWLAAMGAIAASRATFTVPTIIHNCEHTEEGGICDRDLSSHLYKRAAVASDAYLDTMVGAAILSALEMLLFVTTLTLFSIHVHRHRSSHSAVPTSDKLEAQEMQPQQTVFMATSEYPSQYPQQYPQTYNPAYTGQQYVVQQYYDPPTHQQ